MKKTVILLKFLTIVFLSGLGMLEAHSQNLLPDPFVKENNVNESYFKDRTKAKKYNNALFFNYASDEVYRNSLRKIFTIDVEDGDEYFLSAYVNAVYNVPSELDLTDKDKKYPLQEIAVYLDGKFLDNLSILQSGWSSTKLSKNKKLFLSTGRHQIIFESAMPNNPNIEVIKLSTDLENVEFDDEKYNKYLEQLKANMAKNKDNKRKIEQEEIDRKLEEKIMTRSASDFSSNWQVTPYTFNTQGGNYKHKMNVPIVYTYYKKIYLNFGTSVDFHTQPNSPNSYYSVDPVMYLYHDKDISWSDDDGYTGFQSRIAVQIPKSGYYYLIVRAYSNSYASSTNGMQGVVDIYKNGVIFQEDAPVSGYMVNVGTSNTGLLNYFTAYSTGSPKLWLAPDGLTKPIKFKGSTYWNVPPMDYSWFKNARFRIVKNTSSYMDMRMLTSSEGAWWVFWGNCDVYGSCMETSGIAPSSSFPNLKNNDAIQSAPKNSLYNCTAWAGGYSNGWVWHLYNSTNAPVQHNHTSQIWSNWDNYFGNNPLRYNGATTFTRDQANSYNGEVALWSTNGSFSGITHGSIRLTGNNNPHGYDWESKAGQNYRFFHPRDALSGSLYGNIFTYYRDQAKDPQGTYGLVSNNDSESLSLRTKRHTSKPVFSMEESIRRGLTIVEDVKLNQDQISLVKTRSKSKINTLYDSWILKINSLDYSNISNPYTFIETEEGKELVNYSKNNLDESIVFFAEVVFDNQEASFEKYISEFLFCEIVKDKYSNVIIDIKEDWKRNNYDSEGRYIAPLPETFAKKYIKELLNIVVLRNKTLNKTIETSIDSHNLANISPNPVVNYSQINLDLPIESTVSARIYSLSSSIIKTILSDKKLDAGKHSFSFNGNNLESGVYVCIIEINGVRYARRFLKQ